MDESIARGGAAEVSEGEESAKSLGDRLSLVDQLLA
jgi:hypothetical protein